MTIRVAIYARYSSDLQSEASIEDQIRMARQRAEREGWEVVNAYSDRAISGASMNRPDLLRMLHDAADEQFDMVVTEGLDRLSRDQEHIAGIYKKLNFAGVKIFSLSDGGEINDLHIGLKGTMNALFLKDLAIKTKRGLIGRIEKGKLVGKNSFGYDIVRKFDALGEPVRGERTINPEKAAIVRRIFEEYAAGKSGLKIAKILNQENLPSPKGKGWSDWAINGSKNTKVGIINNELYIGRIIWNKNNFIKDPSTGKRVRRANPPEDWAIKEVPEMRIIDQALWDKVKQQQGVRTCTKPLNQKRRPKQLLSFLLKCGCCNGGMSLVSGKRYGCTNAYSKGMCDNRITILRSKLEGFVIQALKGQLMRPELFEVFCEEYQNHMRSLAQNHNATITLAKGKLTRLDSEKKNMIKAIKAGMLSDDFKDAMAENTAEREKAEIQLQDVTQPSVTLQPDMAVRFKEVVTTLCENLDDEQSRDEAMNLIRKLIDKVVLSPDWDKKKLSAELYGNLAEMLTLASSKENAKSLMLHFNTPQPNTAQYYLSNTTDLIM